MTKEKIQQYRHGSRFICGVPVLRAHGDGARGGGPARSGDREDRAAAARRKDGRRRLK